MGECYSVYPVGVIHKDESAVHIQIYEDYTDALRGIGEFSHLMVFYWFHQNDIPEKRQVVEIHPRADPQIPLTGVFATHSPIRPNPIAISLCRKLSVENDVIHIDAIDAFDGSPVIDIKPYIPPANLQLADISVASWV